MCLVDIIGSKWRRLCGSVVMGVAMCRRIWLIGDRCGQVRNSVAELRSTLVTLTLGCVWLRRYHLKQRGITNN
jgi:hypothetical protein